MNKYKPPISIRTQAIELDYGMTSGVRKQNVRTAVAGYVLRRWNGGCVLRAIVYKAQSTIYGCAIGRLCMGWKIWC